MTHQNFLDFQASWETPPPKGLPIGKKLQTRISGCRNVRFLHRLVRGIEEAKTHMHVNFQFFYRVNNFLLYLCGPLYRGR